jgi:hypothetical protein
MGTKCDCGRFYLDPIPTRCSKCNNKLDGGTTKGDTFRIIHEIRKSQNNIISEHGITIEFLKSNTDFDTGNVTMIRR